ncbi:hypothetical protein Sjap_018109 [Stephania japonica]|uniref:Uncharacterized protein n=1 Tax=Stephania japonica TaxID=461633 RepID=A0AAP0NKR8_9MAGN
MEVEGVRERLLSIDSHQICACQRSRSKEPPPESLRILSRLEVGYGSPATSQMEVAYPKKKRPTSSYRKKKVVENNHIPKCLWVKYANESNVHTVETGVKHGGATSSVKDRGGLTIGAGTREDTELSCTQSGDVADIEGEQELAGTSHEMLFLTD